MKKVFSPSELPHVFARQSQSEGRTAGHNFFFENNVIYSYGYHFPIAKILPSGIVLFTTRGYSNTTAKHISKTRSALSHKQLIYVNNPKSSVCDNLISFSKDLKDAFSTIENPRKRPLTKDNAKADIKHIIETATSYCIAMGSTIEKELKQMSKSKSSDELVAASLFRKAMDSGYNHSEFMLKLEKKQTAAKKKAEAERKVKAAEKLEKWLTGEANTYHLDSLYTPLMLRRYVMGEEVFVETTMGARVSFKSAKLLYDMIKSGRDIKGHIIDNYTVIGINGTLKIGCHEIPVAEVDRFAKSMNW